MSENFGILGGNMAARTAMAIQHEPRTSQSLDEKTGNAVKEFEGMLLAQMLQSIRESALGGWQEQSDQSGATALEMAEGQLARMMAANGGLGLAKVLERSLATSSSATTK